MAVVHVVRAGETLVAIAQLYGFRAWETIAQAAENQELIAKRKSPHALEEGDELHIPQPKRGARKFATGNAHEAKVRVGAPLLEVRVYTEFRRVPDGVAAGDKEGTIRGFQRGAKVPPLPVVGAKITVGSSSANTSSNGRVRVDALADGTWTLRLDPHEDEVSPGPALPDAVRDHGVDWGKGNVQRSNGAKGDRVYEVEYRPLDLSITVAGGAITAVRVTSPRRDDRPFHAVCFWGRGVPAGGAGVTQVLEIDLKPDFLRKLYDGEVRPYTRPREAKVSADGRPELFLIHHTGGNLIGGALQGFFALEKKNKSGKLGANHSGVQYVNDRDGHVVRLADDRYYTQHGGGKARLVPAWADGADINDRAIGVENVQGGDEPFTDAQMASLEGLVRAAQEIYGIPRQKTVGHGDCYLGKAADCPGLNFPWKQLEDAGLSLGPMTLDAAARDAMFGGYFAGEVGKKRVLREGDRDVQEGSSWSLRRGGKTIASGLTAGPIATLHERLREVGYVPNRESRGDVLEWEEFMRRDRYKQYTIDTAAALKSFRGHYGAIDRPEISGKPVVDILIASVIEGCARRVAEVRVEGAYEGGM